MIHCLSRLLFLIAQCLFLFSIIGYAQQNPALSVRFVDGKLKQSEEAIYAEVPTNIEGINQVDASGFSYVMNAAMAGMVEELTNYIKAGANVNLQTREGGHTALLLAAKLGQYHTTVALLRAGADPNLQDHQGLSPLHIAIVMGHIYVVRALLDHNHHLYHHLPTADNNNINNTTPTIPHLNQSTITYHPTNLNLRLPIDHSTPFLQSILRGREEMVDLFLSEQHRPMVDLQACTSQGRCALHLAITANKPSILQRLLQYVQQPTSTAEQQQPHQTQHGIDLEARTIEEQETPLLYACKRLNDPLLLELLLQTNRVNLSARNHVGQTALEIASQTRKNSQALIDLLVIYGAELPRRGFRVSAEVMQQRKDRQEAIEEKMRKEERQRQEERELLAALAIH